MSDGNRTLSAAIADGSGMSRRSRIYASMMVSSASTARASASVLSSPNVCASGKSGNVTRTVPLSSEVSVTGYRTIVFTSLQPQLSSHGLQHPLQTEVLLNLGHEPCAQLLCAAVHRQHAHAIAAPNDEVSALAGLERAPLFRKPSFELPAGHQNGRYNTCVAISTL